MFSFLNITLILFLRFSDLLVGAPYYAGESYNEGAVFLYINTKQVNQL